MRLLRTVTPLMLLAWILAGAAATSAYGATSGTAYRARTNVALVGKSQRASGQTSSNWAGYIVTSPSTASSTFTRVSGRWVEPKATCAVGAATYSAFWVGLGGASDFSQALEQIGTSADCDVSGKPRYSMWYELVPAASVPIKLKVFPGNVITASVKVSGNKVTVQIKNLTRKTSFTKTLRMAAPDLSSAEWVAEAPSACSSFGSCRQLPLANFGTVTFSRASVTAAGHTGAIADALWSASSIELIEDVSARLGAFAASSPPGGAIPTDLSTDGAGFAIAWQQAVSPSA